MKDDQEIRNRMVRKMLKKRVVGNHKKQADTVTGWMASHEEGRARELLEEMATDPEAPIQMYGGGHRENVRLVSVEAAVEYLEDHGGNVPFGFG